MKKLYLSRTYRWFGGVCGGLGEYFGVDPTLIRLAWILATLFTGIIPGTVFYLLCWWVVPASPRQ